MTQRDSPSQDPVVREMFDTLYGPSGGTQAPVGAGFFALNPPSGDGSALTFPSGVALPPTGVIGGAPTSGTFIPGRAFQDQTGTVYVVRSLYEQAVRSRNPAAYWRLNDTGSTVIDQMGTYNGTLNGGITQGVAGGLTDGDTAMKFDGSTGYVSASGPTFTTGPFSIAFLAKQPAFVSGSKVWLANADSTLANINWYVVLNSSTDLRFFVGSSQRGYSTTAKDDNAWHYWIFVCDAAGALSIFKDGSLVVTKAGAATPQTTGVSVALGRAGADPIRYFDGSLDEVSIHQSELLAADATALYNAATASFPWAFEQAASLTKAQTWTKTQTFSGGFTAGALSALQGAVDLTKIAAPASPASGLDRLWVDSTTGMLTLMGSNGQAMAMAAGMIANPKAYLGVGDGSADDTTPLNSAYAASGVGTANMLFIQGANWKYTSQLLWNTKNITILGAGLGVTVMKPTAFGGSAVILKGTTTYGTTMQHIGFTGPGIYATPSTNPGNTAGIDGVEIGGSASLSFVNMRNCGKGLVINAGGGGGHEKVYHCGFQQNYYHVFYQTSGSDDFLFSCEYNQAMFASVAHSGGAIPGIGVCVIRTAFTSTPYVFYQAAGAAATFITELTGYQMGSELVGNGFIFSENYATAGSVTYVQFFRGGGGSASTTTERRTDKASDYWITIGSNNSLWTYSCSTSLYNLDKGFLFSQNNPSGDMHFYSTVTDLIFTMGDAGDAHAIRWHSSSGGTYQSSATFGAASGNNATKAIGANTWPGPPASLKLLLSEESDGALTNGFCVMGGVVTSSPTLIVPKAPTASLIVSAGNIDAGAHSYKVVANNGGLNGRVGNSGPSVVSNSVTNDAGDGQNTVTLPTNVVTPAGAPTVTLAVYRNKVADQTHWFLVQAGIALGTVTITDNLADASLGAAMPLTDTSAGWQATVTLKTTAAQTGNPSFGYSLEKAA